MTYDGRDLRVYHNGALVCSQEIGKERVPGTTPLSIGKRQDGYVALTGRVDEVVLFSRVLTAEEVGARFRAAGEPPANDPSAVGQWSFEENAGDREIIEKAMEQAGPEPEYRERLGLREGATQQ
jgi:hypothetical protein